MRVRLCVWVSVFVESKKVASLQISILFYYYFPWPFAIFFFLLLLLLYFAKFETQENAFIIFTSTHKNKLAKGSCCLAFIYFDLAFLFPLLPFAFSLCFFVFLAVAFLAVYFLFDFRLCCLRWLPHKCFLFSFIFCIFPFYLHSVLASPPPRIRPKGPLSSFLPVSTPFKSRNF